MMTDQLADAILARDAAQAEQDARDAEVITAQGTQDIDVISSAQMAAFMAGRKAAEASRRVIELRPTE